MAWTDYLSTDPAKAYNTQRQELDAIPEDQRPDNWKAQSDRNQYYLDAYGGATSTPINTQPTPTTTPTPTYQTPDTNQQTYQPPPTQNYSTVPFTGTNPSDTSSAYTVTPDNSYVSERPDMQQADFNTYFQNAEEGSSLNWGGGTLAMGKNDNAVYTDAQGRKIQFNPNTDIGSIYNHPYAEGIRDLWDTNYGAPVPQEDIKSPNIFQPDKGPVSQSYSGLAPNAIDEIMSSVMPELSKSVSGLADAPEKYADSAMGAYSALSKEALNEQIPQVLESLGRRNMLNSKVASDTLGKAGGDISRGMSLQGYQAGMDEGKMAMDVPAILAQITDAGKMSQSSSTNTLSPYDLMANFIAAY